MADLHRAVAAAGAPARPRQEPPQLADAEQWLGSSADAGEPLPLAPPFQALFVEHRALLTPPQQALAAGHLRMEQPAIGTLVADFKRLLQRHDLICSPTMATVAPVAPEDWRSAYRDNFMGTHFTFIANVAGCPAVSVPCGLVDGLPVGVQIIGRPGDEPTVLRAARAIEALCPMPRPGI
jgi:Asp-tRNA(Asn)/Glu-tRNA(Gln) amidotransferase A subunit family amidase